jgi:broad specificity phosphatase PhoE
MLLLIPKHGDARPTNLFLKLNSENHIMLLRHTLAPGIGDPVNFDLYDCRTQRNLSKKGIKQAQKIGRFLLKSNLKRINIYSSQWCRCKETAKEIALGGYKTLDLLNSFFSNNKIAARQTRNLEHWIKELSLKTPTLLVTHQVNITALIGHYPTQGEIVLAKRLRNGKLTFVGSIEAYDLP